LLASCYLPHCSLFGLPIGEYRVAASAQGASPINKNPTNHTAYNLQPGVGLKQQIYLCSFTSSVSYANTSNAVPDEGFEFKKTSSVVLAILNEQRDVQPEAFEQEMRASHVIKQCTNFSNNGSLEGAFGILASLNRGLCC